MNYNVSEQLLSNNNFGVPESELNLNPRNNNINVNPSNRQEKQGLLSRIFFNPIYNIYNFVSSFCGEKREVDEEEEDRIFSVLPSRVKNLSSFMTIAKNKVGIMFIYSGKNIEEIKNLIGNILKDKELVQIMSQNCTVYSVLGNTNEGMDITSEISDNPFLPIIVFCNVRNNNPRFNNQSVIQKLEGPTNVTVFKNTLLMSIENKFQNINQMGRDQNDSYLNASNAQIIEEQKNELRNLERIEQNKQQQEKEKLLQEKIEQEKKQQKENEMKTKVEKIKAKLVEEPSQDNPNSTLIIFRFPDGERREERRFLKSNTIQNLYDYVESFGNEIYTDQEGENNSFSLMQTFPMKIYNDKKRTLEEEGLYPNAVLQIREEE